METEVTCYLCYETFEVYFDLIEGNDSVIIDWDICCNPNFICYQINDETISVINIDSGND